MSAVVSTGLEVGYIRTILEDDVGMTAGILPACAHTLSPRSNNGLAIDSLGAFLLSLVSVFDTP